MRPLRLLYRELLPTLGDRGVPMLLRRLRRAAAENDAYLFGLITDGLASAPGTEAAEAAISLLHQAEPALQLAGLRIVARHPTPACLDRLWQIHRVAAPRGLGASGDVLAPDYGSSFDALRACLVQDPGWLAGAIERARPEDEPVHDLAYLLANLEGQAALWQACKRRLFDLVGRRFERALAVNIFLHRDAAHLDWLVARVDRPDELVGPWCLRALCRLDPDRAVAELPRLPLPLWPLTRDWCFAEIQRARPAETRACFRRVFEGADDGTAAQLAAVYDSAPSDLDLDTLDLLLVRFHVILTGEITAEAPGLPPFNVLCGLLSRLSRLDQLDHLARLRGTMLEARLAGWLLRRVAVSEGFQDPIQKQAIQLLHKFGGDGYTRVVNRHLNGTDVRLRLWALGLAVRRPDWETRYHLRYLARKEELLEGHAVEQGHATLALAALGEEEDVVEAVVAWGLNTLEELPRVALGNYNDRSLARAFAAGSQPGAILALGIGGHAASAGQIRAWLREADPASKVAHAAVIALWLLRDGAEEAVPAIERQLLNMPRRCDAINCLLSNNSGAAQRALVAHLGRVYDHRLAVLLLGKSELRPAVEPIVQRALADRGNAELPTWVDQLLASITDVDVLERIVGGEGLYALALERAFGPVPWLHVPGAKAGAIRVLSRYDQSAALEALRTRLRDPQDRDRDQYPHLLVELAPERAIPWFVELITPSKQPALLGAVGRAVAQLHRGGRDELEDLLLGWTTDQRPPVRQVACGLAGWLDEPGGSLLDAVRARLEDVDEKVSAAAVEALARQRLARDVLELVDAFERAAVDRRWQLLDAALELGEVGEPHLPAPAWLGRLASAASPVMHLHLEREVRRKRERAKEPWNELE